MTGMVGELMTLILMAIALGMDAFSVGLGMGMIKLKMRQIFYIGITIGIFHVFMPLGGMLIGKALSEQFGSIATFIGGLLLIMLGVQMMLSSLKKEDGPLISPIGAGLILFAISVSLDSFSVGLSLGIYGAKTLLTILMFGAVSMFLTWMGLLFGRHLQGWLGSYSEALGGSILLGFGLKLLFFT